MGSYYVSIITFDSLELKRPFYLLLLLYYLIVYYHPKALNSTSKPFIAKHYLTILSNPKFNQYSKVVYVIFSLCLLSQYYSKWVYNYKLTAK